MAVATVDIQINSQGAVRSLNQVDLASRNTQSALQKLDGVVGSLAASFAAGFAINRVINDVKELDTNIRRLGTVGVNVAKINPALSALSDRLGGVANKAELAAASYQAASAGFSDTAGNIRILEAATKAATGGLADNQGVTEVLVKTLNAYGMSGTQAYQVTDSISKAVELGNQEWSDYVSQLGRVASMAALAGVSLDEMNAFIASATKNGATAEVAFTGLSSVLTQLLQPTKESQTAAAQLGIQWNLMGLQTKGLGGLMKELAVAIDKDKEAAARMVGPTEAMRGAFAAASKDGKDFETILGQIGNASGKTDADFQTMKGSLENTFKALDTSFKNLSEALGKAFGPTLVITIQDITKGVNGFATAMSAVPQPVMDAVGTIIKVTAQIILLQKAMQGVIALRAAYVLAMGSMATTTAAAGAAANSSASAFALYTNNIKTLETASAASTTKVAGLLRVVGSLAAIGGIVITVDLIVKGIGDVIAATREIMRLRGIRAGGGAAAQFAGASRETVVGAQKDQKKILAGIQRSQKANELNAGQKLAQTVLGGLSPVFGLPTAGQQAQRAQLYQEQTRFSQGVLGLDPMKFKETTPKPQETTQTSNSSDPNAGKDEKKKADKAARDAARLAEQTKTQLDAAYKLNALAAADLGIQTSMTKEETLQGQFDKAALERRIKFLDLQKSAKSESERQSLASAQLSEILIANNKYAKDKKDLLEQQTAELYSQLDISGVLDKTLQNRLSGAFMGNTATGTFGTQMDLMPELTGGKAGKKIEELKTQISELTNIGNMAITAADGIGAAFADSFQGLIQGSMNAQQALGNFFKSVANMFLEMAAQIIAKQMAMIVLQSILKALGAAVGGGSVGSTATNYGGGAGVSAFNPASFSMGSLVGGRAIGGPVTGNASYMVGERGPEIFTPSTSGNITPNNRLRDVMGGNPASAGGGQMLNMTFETTRFGNTEYVSRDQLEAAMAQTRRQAANDGAKRGMGMTLDKLQQSPQTRSRVGIR